MLSFLNVFLTMFIAYVNHCYYSYDLQMVDRVDIGKNGYEYKDNERSEGRKGTFYCVHIRSNLLAFL